MKEADVLKDLLSYVAALQSFYNDNVLNIVNPEARQLFIQLRDDETRFVVKLQQKIERVESKARIISRILPAKNRY
jgi:predicted LPLAT superfamily acyltransferase